jgi:hypothetical protein
MVAFVILAYIGDGGVSSHLRDPQGTQKKYI